MRRSLPILLLVVLPACGVERAATEDYVEVVRQTVAVMAQDARTQGLGRAPQGPLWVDLRAFAGRAREVTGEAMTIEALHQALGDSIRQAEPRQVLLAPTEEDVLGGTWVREYGVLVSPNAARGTSEEITLLVGNYSTDRRQLPTSICERLWRLRFTAGPAGEWTLVDRELTRGCLPDGEA